MKNPRTMVSAAVLLAVLASSCADDDSVTTSTAASTSTTAAPTTTTSSSPSEQMWSGSAPNMTPVDDTTAAEWQALVDGVLAQSIGTPGVWIAVSHPELGFWSTAIGEAVAGGRPAAPDDHGRIGSITKTFTAVAVLEQVALGTLNLDDTVADVVPDLAAQFPPTADITIEQLLAMTSGLGDYANVPGAATAQAVEDPTRIWTPEDLIASALEASDVQPVGTPGYSTTNYAILGRMLEAVTGRTVEDVLTDLANRAGLQNTALLPGDQNGLPDPSTHGYIDAAGADDLTTLAGVSVPEGTDVTDWSMSWGGAGGGMYSSIDDLFAWTAGAMGTTMLPESLGEQRITLNTLMPDAVLRYGLGISGFQGVEGWVGHAGQTIGWEGLGMYQPETGATIAVMVNSTGGLTSFYTVWTQIFGIGA